VGGSGAGFPPTVQPLRVVQPDAVCEVGGSTPDLPYGDLGIFPGRGQTEKSVHWPRNNTHTGDAPSNQPKVAGVFPPRNVGLEVNLFISLTHTVGELSACMENALASILQKCGLISGALRLMGLRVLG